METLHQYEYNSHTQLCVGYHCEGSDTFESGGRIPLISRSLDDRRPLFMHHGADDLWQFKSDRQYEIVFHVRPEQIWTADKEADYYKLIGVTNGYQHFLPKSIMPLVEQGYRWFVLTRHGDNELESFLIYPSQHVRLMSVIFFDAVH